MALTRIVIETPLTAAQDLANLRMNGTGSWRNVFSLMSWLRGFAKGTRRGNMLVKSGAVRATGAITFTGRPVADETLTVCNVTLTAKDSGANGTTQFNTSLTDSTTATNLAACINANTSLTGKVTATALLGVVTITAVVPGLSGNGLDLTENMTTTAKTAFAGGTDGTAYSLTLGQVIA